LASNFLAIPVRLERPRAPSCQGQFLKGGYTGETMTWKLIINTWKMYIPSLQFWIPSKFIEYQCNISKEKPSRIVLQRLRLYKLCSQEKLLSSPDANYYWLVDMKPESYQAMVKPPTFHMTSTQHPSPSSPPPTSTISSSGKDVGDGLSVGTSPLFL